MEASEIRPRLRLVREVRPRSKAADSKSTQVVSSVTSLFSPPMTPASATARSGVAMTVMSLGERAILAVQGGQVLAVGGGAHDDVGAPVGAGHFREVEGVQRLAVEVQDVVRHVHDVVDGTAPGSGHALGEPFGGGPHLHVVDDPGGVARAARGIGHLNGDSGRPRPRRRSRRAASPHRQQAARSPAAGTWRPPRGPCPP